jgi:hypothetical protein
MGFFDKLAGDNVGTIPHYKLNETGEERLRKSLPGSDEFIILSTVKKLQPCTISEIAKELGRSEERAYHTLVGYRSYVQKTG